MDNVLIIRDEIVKFIKRFEIILFPIIKFLFWFFVFSQLSSIEYIHSMFEPFADNITSTAVNLLFAVLFSIMPMNLNWIILIFAITIRFSANLELAIALFICLLAIFLFYARLAPKESILILITVLAFNFNIPFIVPIFVGMYFTATAIIPVAIGVFVNAQIPVLLAQANRVGALAQMAELEEIDLVDLLTELPAAFMDIYDTLMVNVLGSREWIFTAVIFVMVILLVYFICRQALDNAKEIAIIAGCVMIIFGFVVITIFIGDAPGIGGVIIGTLISGVIAYIIKFFDTILDYSRAESVQFEDDVNFYHVKIVPKVTVTKATRSIRTIRSGTPNPDEDED